MNNNTDSLASKEAIQLEQLPFNNHSSQYYTACEEDRVKRIEERQTGRVAEEGLIAADHESMTMQEASRWRYAALTVSWMSVIVLLIIGIVSFVISQSSNSSAAFGFAFDCILDVGTSVVVLWRFMGSVGTVYSPEKERIALLFLGALFLIAAVSIFSRTIPDIIDAGGTTGGISLIILSGISFFFCTGLAIAKFIIAKRLDSKSILSDGYSSLAGAITALSMLISTVVIHFEADVWYLDEIIGMIVGVLLTVYGIKLLVETTQSDDMRCSGKFCLKKKRETLDSR